VAQIFHEAGVERAFGPFDEQLMLLQLGENEVYVVEVLRPRGLVN
jgi:hypothetical protein